VATAVIAASAVADGTLAADVVPAGSSSLT